MERTHNDPVILIVDDDAQSATKLREMIEFLDSPAVEVADFEHWQKTSSQLRLAALFIGTSISEARVELITEQLHNSHPDVPVVVLEPEAVNGG